MTNRRDLLLIFILALFIRTAAALPQQQPNYMDAAYSYVNALNLAEGRGFVEDFVWNYLADPPPPPKPSHLYWMPLTSILAWLGMLVGGVSYRAAQIPFILLSALLVPLTYWITHTLSGQRWHSWVAALLMIFSGFYFPFWAAIDNFTPFALVGSLALLLAWLGTANDKRQMTNDEGRLATDDPISPTHQLPITNSQFPNPPISQSPNLSISQSPNLYLLGSGLCLGLAHLARADGPLLLITILLFYGLHLLHSLRPTPHISRFTFHVLRFTLPLLLGYLLLITPWLIRNWSVTGSPFPTAGTQTIWLTGYDDLFSYGRTFSAQTFFAQEIGAILQGRWWALTANFQTILAVWCMIFLLPLVIIGMWTGRRHLLLQLAGLYALLLFLAMTFVFAFPGARGGLFHSGTALLPFIYAAAVLGLDHGVDWVAARRRRWRAASAKQVFAAGLVMLAIFISGFVYYNRVLKNDVWNQADRLYPAIAAWVAENDPQAIVMINNPPAYRYHGGGLSVVVPNEDVDTLLRVGVRYGVDYLVLDRNHPAPLADLYAQNITNSHLSLVKTFAQGSNHEIYVFKIIPSK